MYATSTESAIAVRYVTVNAQGRRRDYHTRLFVQPPKREQRKQPIVKQPRALQESMKGRTKDGEPTSITTSG